MNFTLDKKKCIYIVIWLLIGLLSFTVLGKYASAPESHQATIASLDEKKATVLELSGGHDGHICTDYVTAGRHWNAYCREGSGFEWLSFDRVVCGISGKVSGDDYRVRGV